VNQTTNYTFYIESKWTDTLSVTVQKPITIQVQNYEATTAGVVAIIITQAILVAVVVFTLVSSFITSNSTYAIWTLVNQLQIITLLMLVDSFTPEDFIDYLEGISFVSFNFDFIPFKDVPYLNWLTEELDVELDDRKLNVSRIQSRSSFVNLFSIMIMFLTAFAMHVLLFLLPNNKPRPA
jgi:hypothetical protein